jgi:hypothetical protein
MDAEWGMVQEAAKYLRISPGTLFNWITRKQFTDADGLRRFGGSTRIHMPTLKARAMANEVLKGGARPPQVITKKPKRVVARPRKQIGRPRKSRPQVFHFESVESTEFPELTFDRDQMPAAAGR